MGSGTSDISVIIPYYNRERYIDEAVQSALSQTLKPLEIIIVNDCSQESSRRYLDRYTGVCTILDLPVNVGLSGSRNAGIRAARGQVIALLDDDDVWLPNKLEVQRNYLEDRPECSGVHSAIWMMLPQQQQMFYSRFAPGPMTLAQALTNDYWVVPSTMMFRTDVVRALGGFDPAFRQCEDRDFIVRFCAAGYQIEGISEPLTRYRREGQTSLTSRRWLIFRSDMKMCWKHKALYLRAYGFWGIVNFVLEKLQDPTSGSPFVYRVVRRLIRFTKPKCRTKASYREPVGNRRPLTAAARLPIESANVMGGQSL